MIVSGFECFEVYLKKLSITSRARRWCGVTPEHTELPTESSIKEKPHIEIKRISMMIKMVVLFTTQCPSPT